MFKAALAQTAEDVETCLHGVIATHPAGRLRDAMTYASTGGKRLRAFLVVESARLYGIYPRQSIWAAAAVEAMHAYSLVHDDLPAMDDDDLRRGNPTVHIKWDEALAILAGDGLQSLAYDILSRNETAPKSSVRLELISSLARASGAQGMVLGQVQDMAAETSETPLDLDAITELQSHKTGALIEWSAMAGPVLAGADVGPLRSYAQNLGLAFQIADDILDVEGDVAKTGKRLNKDADAGKATFVSLLGLEGARARAEELIDAASSALAPFGEKAQNLKDAAQYVIARDQ